MRTGIKKNKNKSIFYEFCFFANFLPAKGDSFFHSDDDSFFHSDEKPELNLENDYLNKTGQNLKANSSISVL